MRSRGLFVCAVVTVLAVIGVVVPAAQAAPPERGTIQIASTSVSDGTKGADGASNSADITPDGRFVVFTSLARNLVASPPSGDRRQVYLRDTATGKVRLVSATADGVQAGTAPSTNPAISDDGKRVAFITEAKNLVLAAASGVAHAVVWSSETGAIDLVSADKAFPSDRNVTDVDISGDGNVVAFSTTALNLTNIPTYNKSQVYRRDLAAGTTTIVSVSDTGLASVMGAQSPSVSRDGKAIAFAASGIELYGSMPEPLQIYRYVVGNAKLERVTQSVTTTPGGDADSRDPSISADGDAIAYSSVATNLDLRARRGNSQIFLRQMRWSGSSVVSVPQHRGGASNGECTSPSLSADGSRLAFVCTSSDLVPGAGGSAQLYVGEMGSQSVRLVSRSSSGAQADKAVAAPALSGDGAFVAFSSEATNIVAGSSGNQVFIGTGVAKPAVERIGGADRYAASAAISRVTFPPGAPVAYIASGQGFADALPGSAVAGRQSGPVLLVMRDSLPTAISDELKRLNPAKVVVLGGTDTITTGVEEALKALAPSVTRISGADRYLGSAVLSAAAYPDFEVSRRVFVAAGENYPDALAGAALAGVARSSVLLTQRDHVSSEVLAEIERLRAEEIVVLGGTSSVSASVFEELKKVAPAERLAGTDRYGTAAAIAAGYSDTGRTVYIASGETYPDALSASAAAVQSTSPVLLVSKSAVPDSTKAALQRLTPSRIVVVGGPNTITDSVLKDLEEYLAP